MEFKKDDRFKAAATRARGRRRVRWAVWGGAGLAVVLGVYVGLSGFTGGEDVDDGITLVQSDETADETISLAAAGVEAFLDIRGEPMIINLGRQDVDRLDTVEAPRDFAADRLRPGSDILKLEEPLMRQGVSLDLTLPSTAADLAAFQLRRANAQDTLDLAADDGVAVAEGDAVTVDIDDGSWGGSIEGVSDGGEAAVSYVDTVIENTTTQAVITHAARRKPFYEDRFVDIVAESSFGDLADALGISAGEAGRLGAAMERTGLVGEALPIGGLVALRKQPSRPSDAQALHVTVYGPDGYLTTLAQVGVGRFRPSANPWIGQDLLSRRETSRETRQNQGEARLVDGVYAAAVRNGLGSALAGQLVIYLSRQSDLDAVATPDMDLTVLFARHPDTGEEHILYAGIKGRSMTLSCYVVPVKNRDYGCFDRNNYRSAGAGGSGLLIPVSGTKTSGFGPRHHPILKRTINHNGVDWAAPTGTPIYAAMDGTIASAGVGGGYGNVVKITHPGSMETRYAHLHKFGAGIKRGAAVKAGDLIGYVGTTGRSTGPHLHFELWVMGRPVDPLTFRRDLASGGGGAASGAVDALVARIIQIESGGNARAKNTRSSATGLGQFINSTWLRMMKTYRPDLVAKHSREDLLNLRFDPALSREMVRNMARENEAFLRRNGIGSTPGRLYLAHFLGPKGAVDALKSDQALSVREAMGENVVKANPFLKDWSVADMVAWADRKMGKKVRASTVAAAPAAVTKIEVPAEIEAFRRAVDRILERSG